VSACRAARWPHGPAGLWRALEVVKKVLTTFGALTGIDCAVPLDARHVKDRMRLGIKGARKGARISCPV